MTDFNDFVVAGTTASTDVIVPGVVDGSTPTRKLTITSAAQSLLDDTSIAAMASTVGAFATASSSGGSSVPLDFGNKTKLLLTITGNVTSFALPTNGPAGTLQETFHTLRVVASGATRTIASSAFSAFSLASSVVPAEGWSIVDGASLDFALTRVHNGAAAVWFVDLAIDGASVRLNAGTAGHKVILGSNKELTSTVDSGSSPGGSDTHVQFNDSSAFGGDAGLTFNKTSNILTVTGGVVVGTSLELVAAAMPSSGSFTAGDYVRNSAIVVRYGLKKQRLRGWFRATTGSNHVLHTDWYEDWAAIYSDAQFMEVWDDFVPSSSTSLHVGSLNGWVYSTGTGGALTVEPGEAEEALGVVKLVGPTASAGYLRSGVVNSGGYATAWANVQEFWFRAKFVGASGSSKINFGLLAASGSINHTAKFAVTGLGNIFAETSDGTTLNAIDTTIAPDGNHHAFSIVRNGSGNFEFYIDGTLRATSTTNLPTNTSGITIDAGSTFTSSGQQTLYLDAVYLRKSLTSARW